LAVLFLLIKTEVRESVISECDFWISLCCFLKHIVNLLLPFVERDPDLYLGRSCFVCLKGEVFFSGCLGLFPNVSSGCLMDLIVIYE